MVIDNNLKFEPLQDMDNIEYIIFHHTGTTARQSVETIHNFHKNTRGWSGIGYHFYIRRNGDIYKGRPTNKRGVHTKGQNYRSLAICLEGNFEIENPTEEQYKSSRELVEMLRHTYKELKVKQHKDFGDTKCAGANFNIEEVFPKEDIPNWKLEGVNYLVDKGLINDKQYWTERIDDTMPTWAIMLVMKRIHENIKGGKSKC